MAYIYDINRLLPGDVILKRTPGDYISDRVRQSTHSEYSHAMLYLGNSSYMDVGHRVQARNPQRYIFENIDDTCLLRLKRDLWTGEAVSKAIEYARNVVANPYSIRDALNLEEGRVCNSTENTQICTRLVAKAFYYAGVQIVDNVEMCTPQEILESPKFNRVDGCYRLATDLDIQFSKSYDVIDDMIKATDKLITLMSIFDGGNLRSIEDICNYAINHPNDDIQIACLLKESGYLDVLGLDRLHNKHLYDPEEFIKYYGRAYRSAALQTIESNLAGVEMYELELQKYLMVNSLINFRSTYLELQIDLYRRIIASYRQRAFVGMLVMQSCLS